MSCCFKADAVRLAVAMFLVTVLCTVTMGQSFEQTLPSGLLNTNGSTSTSLPFNSTIDSTWQWAYDTSQFAHNGPILINELYWRANLTSDTVGLFDISDLEITLIESTNDTASLSTTFNDNIRRGEVVRSGPYINTFETPPTLGTAHWIPLRLSKSFLFDPTGGRDLIVQLRICGVNVSPGVSIDAHISGTHAARVGHSGNCAATTSNFGPQTLAPVLKIDYTPVLEQTLPFGHMGGMANSQTGIVTLAIQDQIWQWHYDVGEFISTGPITISEVSLRPDTTFLTVPAFDYTDVEVTLIEASTGYGATQHDPILADNILRSKVVRSGRWTAPPTQKDGDPVGTWISFQLTETFDYDPTLGNDLIVQVRVCGNSAPWGVPIDGVIGTPGTVGGNIYGDPQDCNAVNSGPQPMVNEFVPIVKISYTEREIATFPYKENFDNWGPRFDGTIEVPPGWIHDHPGNEDGWFMYNTNHSVGTTPVDHTTGRNGVGYYASTEDSFSNSSSESLETPIFNLALLSEPIASFWLYSQSTADPNGLDENSLNLDILRHNPDGTITPFVGSTLFGPVYVIRSGCWTKYAYDLAAFTSERVSLRFRASADSDGGFLHDFALDDFCIANRVPVEGGQAPTVEAELDINDAYNVNGEHVRRDVDGPYYTCARLGGKLYIRLEGPLGLQPTALWIGPMNIGVASFGTFGQMDTGTPDINGDGIPESLFVVGDATSLTPSFFDLLFFTDVAGRLDLSFTVNPGFPLGTFGAFQGIVGNGSNGIFLTNAIELTIVP